MSLLWKRAESPLALPGLVYGASAFLLLLSLLGKSALFGEEPWGVLATAPKCPKTHMPMPQGRVLQGHPEPTPKAVGVEHSVFIQPFNSLLSSCCMWGISKPKGQDAAQMFLASLWGSRRQRWLYTQFCGPRCRDNTWARTCRMHRC